LKTGDQKKLIISFKQGLVKSGISFSNVRRVMTDLYRRFPKVGFTFKFIYLVFHCFNQVTLKDKPVPKIATPVPSNGIQCRPVPTPKPLLETVVSTAPPVTHLPRQRDASSAGVTFLTPKIQEMQTQDLEARLALAKSIKAVIEKNYKTPTGPEVILVSMTRTLFGSQIEALKALVRQFMTALKVPFEPK
jgi:hypothetical protein